jgi:hypothetical protein
VAEEQNTGDLNAALDRISSELHDLRARISRAESPTTQKSESRHGALLKKERTTEDPTDFRIYVPFAKVEEAPDGSLIIEAWANVSDFVDSDGEFFSRKGLRKFVDSWKTCGNFRLQHDPSKPIGTINPPWIGKSDPDKPLGADIRKHPETNTDAIWVRFCVDDDEGIRKTKKGIMTGLSVGGRIPEGGRVMVEVEVDERGLVIYDQAA